MLSTEHLEGPLTRVLVSTYVCKDACTLPAPSSPPHPQTLEEDKQGEAPISLRQAPVNQYLVE